MIDNGMEGRGVLGPIDSLGQLFGSPGEGAREPMRAIGRFAKLELELDALLAALGKRMERPRPTAPRADPRGSTACDLDEERLRRKATAHRTIRADIEEMHARLRTGLTRVDVIDIVAFLQGLADFSGEGCDSHALFPRVRHAITERLRAEAGAMALDRLVARLKRRGFRWPNPAQYHPHPSHEEVEASRRRRMSDVRTTFVCYGLERIAERAQGIVSGWGADYPDRGSLLWRESVLLGVAAAFWGRLLQHFVELLRQDGDLLLSHTEELVSAKLAVLNAMLENRSASVAEAREAVASSLRILDEATPEMAWRLVQARLPRVRPSSSGEALDAGATRQAAHTASDRL